MDAAESTGRPKRRPEKELHEEASPHRKEGGNDREEEGRKPWGSRRKQRGRRRKSSVLPSYFATSQHDCQLSSLSLQSFH
jgi:hypothetical protein